MQFIKIDSTTTLKELTELVGAAHINDVLHLNELEWEPNVGRQFLSKCNEIMYTGDDVSVERKINMLGKLSSDADVFEHCCLMGDSSWKVMDVLGTIPGYLKLPDDCQLPPSDKVLGGTGNISDIIFRVAMLQMQTTGEVNPTIFSDLSSTNAPTLLNQANSLQSNGIFGDFKFPWGKITLYSSLSDSSMDIPCYPEDFSDSRKASYTELGDLLYQYEPWMLYQDSGPRQVTYKFHFHRDMWNGDHRLGGANKLIRFCEANCYPRYNGSSVITSTVTLYIDGRVSIHGILIDVSTDWDGPIGLDGWYLNCNMSLTITEISKKPLSYDTIMNMPIIG